jgi:hypothetical protein
LAIVDWRVRLIHCGLQIADCSSSIADYCGLRIGLIADLFARPMRQSAMRDYRQSPSAIRNEQSAVDKPQSAIANLQSAITNASSNTAEH